MFGNALISTKISRAYHLISPSLLLFTFVLGVGIAADDTNTAVPEVVTIPYPAIKPSEGQSREIIARGEYLAKAGDCIACHTDVVNNGPVFAGGLAVDTPFGKIYTTNITPDVATGIGAWTDQQFIHAMHKGKGPGGKHYFPVFPFTSFTKVSDEDLLAIKAYLFALPPVAKAPTPNEMRFPFNIRFLQMGWKLLFFRAGYFEPNPDVPEKINRGAYLVQGLGHCAECHSPRNIFGGIKKKYMLTGGFVDGYFAPDITAYGIGDAPVSEVVQVMKEGTKLRGRGHVQGPMKDVVVNSLQYLSDDDLEAMAEYLKRYEAPIKRDVVAVNVGDISSDAAKKIYRAHCAVCHDLGSANAPKISDAATWQTRLDAQGIEKLKQNAIQGYNSMPAKGACMQCADAEIEATVQWMVDSAVKSGGTAKAVKPKGPKPKVYTKADGKVVYQNYCAVCHDSGQLGAPKLGDKAAWAPRIAQNMDVLITHIIHGHKFEGVASSEDEPLKNICLDCNDAELIAAIKYMVDTSSDGNHDLW